MSHKAVLCPSEVWLKRGAVVRWTAGGGIGGLVTAGKLAQHGYSVTVLEKNAEVQSYC